MSFLGIDGLHAFVTGAAGGIGSAIVKELLANGANVTAHDLRPISGETLPASSKLRIVQGDIADEASIASSFKEAFTSPFGPVSILAANAGITDESASYPLWELPTELWDRVYSVNVRGTFFTVKNFLSEVQSYQRQQSEPLRNLAVVITGSECGKFGQAGHAEYASGKAALQYGLVRTVKNEIGRLNARGRVNAVAPGWVDTALIGDRLADPREMWAETQGTVALRKIAQPEDVARTVAFLASERVSGHISGQCVSVDGGMEGRVVWREEEIISQQTSSLSTVPPPSRTTLSTAPTLKTPKQGKIKVLLSVDFDAVSGWLGTGQHPSNNMSDYSAGFFSARVGVPRLLRLFSRLGVSKHVTWFLPGHSIESFPDRARAIVASGAEIGLHGYCHEGAPQLTEQQEADVLDRCIAVAHALTGKPPAGYRAPLYQLRESTAALLQARGLRYDASLTHHDSRMYRLPASPIPAIVAPAFTPDARAADWMVPLPQGITAPDAARRALVEVPSNWYGEDMTPLQFYPHTENSAGYVPTGVVEGMWKERMEFLIREANEEPFEGEVGPTVFTLTLHPDTSGMAHIIGMVERFIGWCKGLEKEGIVEFSTMGDAVDTFVKAGG
ncbi:hypothetical protein FH972_026366 [Carpinus fangiana]|uniref:NodB homology domain-containing protein n=1 Tax=Carpinus fangiana TaxID=176857 RepID=A0A5N6L499_9ROSI|nr:hypothetical protein FH972_026366 [Carpinus fangiana]